MRLSLGALILLVACGGRVDYVTRHGLYVTDDTQSVEQDRIEYLTDQALTVPPVTVETIRGTTVEIVAADEVVRSDCPAGHHCVGITVGHHVWLAGLDRCPYGLGLPHELLHVVIGDPGHADPTWVPMIAVQRHVMCEECGVTCH